MNEIYDNGYYLLGKVSCILEYTFKIETSDVEETFYEIQKDLDENYNYDDIVCIYYDNPMGYSIEHWTKDDILKEEL